MVLPGKFSVEVKLDPVCALLDPWGKVIVERVLGFVDSGKIGGVAAVVPILESESLTATGADSEDSLESGVN